MPFDHVFSGEEGVRASEEAPSAEDSASPDPFVSGPLAAWSSLLSVSRGLGVNAEEKEKVRGASAGANWEGSEVSGRGVVKVNAKSSLAKSIALPLPFLSVEALAFLPPLSCWVEPFNLSDGPGLVCDADDRTPGDLAEPLVRLGMNELSLDVGI